MRTVTFYCMRHGHRLKGGDELSKLGYKQVEASAKEHLSGINFVATFSSGMHRANQSAALILGALGITELYVQREEGFSFEWFWSDPNMPKVEMLNYATIGEYFDNMFPLAFATRGRVMQTLLHLASSIVAWSGADREGPLNVLVVSHSPTIDTAVPEPKGFPRLKEADICVYNVSVDDQGHSTIESARYLSAPKVEENDTAKV